MGLLPSIPQIPGGANETVNFSQAMVPASLFATGFTMSVHGGAINPTIKEMYSIAVLDLTKGLNSKEAIIKGVEDPHSVGRGTTKDDSGEFFFSVPPKVVELGEPYTTKIIPTQNGGKYVESHGSIIREIRVEGNSGLRPNKPLSASLNLLGGLPLGPLAGPVNNIAGPIINKAAAIGGAFNDVAAAFGLVQVDRDLDPSERTGYDDIMKLRNIFRRYSDIKASDNSSKIIMVWRDIKNADYWIVEPKEFKLVQDSKSPMTYNYHLTLRTLSRFEYMPNISPDPLKGLKAGAKQIATIQKALREVSTTLVVVSGSIDRLAAIGVFAQNLLVEPMITVIQGASAIVNSAKGIQPSVAHNWQRLTDNLQTALDTLDEQLYPNVRPTGSGPVSPITIALTQEEQDRADSYADIVHALRGLQRAARNVLIQPSIQMSLSSVVSDRQNRASNAFRKFIPGGGAGGELPTTVGDASFIGNQSYAGALSSAVVGAGETIFSLAQRLLGNRNQWKILVLINDLRPPYISTSPHEQTIAPGEYIYYPVQGGPGIQTQEINPSDREMEQRGENPNSVVDRAYGRDIRLRSDGDNRTDLVISADGDLASIQGVANVKQGLRLKFSTEQGTLTVHPQYGAAFPVGTKMTSISLNLFRLNAYSTIISDPRVQSVAKLDFYAQGDVLGVGAQLVLKDRADSSTTNFEITG